MPIGPSFRLRWLFRLSTAPPCGLVRIGARARRDGENVGVCMVIGRDSDIEQSSSYRRATATRLPVGVSCSVSQGSGPWEKQCHFHSLKRSSSPSPIHDASSRGTLDVLSPASISTRRARSPWSVVSIAHLSAPWYLGASLNLGPQSG